MEGQIVVPVSLAGACPSLRLAILMAHKTDQINKQPFCRVRLAQCPADDPETGTYIWGDGEWQRFP